MIRGNRGARGTGRENPFGAAGVAGEVVVLEHTKTNAGIGLDDGPENFYGRSSARNTEPDRVVDIVIEYQKTFAEFLAERFQNLGFSHEAMQAQAHDNENVFIRNAGRSEFFRDKREQILRRAGAR